MRWASLRSAQPTAHRTRLRQRSLVTNPSSRIPAFRSVAHLLLAMLPALLGIEAQRGDRPRFQALEADFLVGLLAEAVAAFLDALERLVDLRDQLAVTVARAQLERVLGFARRAFGLVADVAHFVAQVVDRLLGLLDQVLAPLLQLGAEVGKVARAHVFLFRRRVIAR